MPKSCENVTLINVFRQQSVDSTQNYTQISLRQSQIEYTVANIEKRNPEVRAPGSDCAEIGCVVPPILAQTSINASHNHFLACEEPVEYNDSSEEQWAGDFRIPRWIEEHPLWNEANAMYRMVLVTLVRKARYIPEKFNDFGVSIDVGIGQYCCSRFELAKQVGKGCDPDQARRAVDHFCKHCPGFRQVCAKQVPNQRMLITVCFLVRSDEKKKCRAQASAQVSARLAPTKEESNNLIINKEYEYPTPPTPQGVGGGATHKIRNRKNPGIDFIGPKLSELPSMVIDHFTARMQAIAHNRSKKRWIGYRGENGEYICYFDGESTKCFDLGQPERKDKFEALIQALGLENKNKRSH